MKKIFVGRLAYCTSEETVRRFFSHFGEIGSVRMVDELVAGCSHGCVELLDNAMADEAIRLLNGGILSGKRVMVRAASTTGTVNTGTVTTGTVTTSTLTTVGKRRDKPVLPRRRFGSSKELRLVLCPERNFTGVETLQP